MIVKESCTINIVTDDLDLAHLEIQPISWLAESHNFTLYYLDILLRVRDDPEASSGAHNTSTKISSTNSAIGSFLGSLIVQCHNDPPVEPIGVRFLIPSTTGYITRNDFLEQRLECSPHVRSVYSFVTPLQQVHGLDRHTKDLDLNTTLSRAVGAVVLHSASTFPELDVDLTNRLSFPWILPDRILPRRIAWVQGREDVDCIERAFKAAAALGITLVILDEAGHWLQPSDSPWAYLREAFVEVDISPDDGLATRVADAVRSYPEKIEGIVTISDVRLAAIAKACNILGLQTENPDAYEIAADKGRTRQLESVGVKESFVLQHAEDLNPYLERLEKPLEFPLVVKPVIGWCSDCVAKVRTLDELVIAVRKASDRHAESAKKSTAVVVEPYIDGPEVDANFAILNGEILFLDISDDFPSPADKAESEFKANFQETQNVMPSGLPDAEVLCLRTQLLKSIRRQGFNSGIFHCEARVRNSRARYAEKDCGVVDLATRTDLLDLNEPEIYLHEINARPPGYLESVAVLLTYGVDYYALRMLLALGPSEAPRLRALSLPFVNGPQFHLSLMIIQQTRAGIMKTADAAREFLDKHSEMKQHVVDYYTRKKGGDILEGPDASALWWIAYFSVTSRHSRQELLERVGFVLEHFEYEIEA
ncbi:hypothetical protein P154DRAFT_534347 [Amniculicola lignicola CBS 123094]|uniref:ATP-grasp domain-containing protein n=1 Tax=Amniculicola lignicola CBS 123094 TaxID=1392246 RepID=A0A6A5WHH8_9PLEO|nr:hypothetical protein P154DRAFT_534347 [Amniculicola lignicola CBS 123094]